MEMRMLKDGCVMLTARKRINNARLRGTVKAMEVSEKAQEASKSSQSNERRLLVMEEEGET